MALLASASTLIAALQLDSITGSQHAPNREMLAQGAGNIAAGLVGGLTSAAYSGSFVNVFSGGRSAAAGITVALMFLAVMIFLAPVAERIPLSVLAAILFINGWSIIDRRILARIHLIPRSYALVLLLTALRILFVNMTVAMLVGLVVAALVVAALVGRRRLEDVEVRTLISVPLLDMVVLDGEGPDDASTRFEARTRLVKLPDRVTVASAREINRILRPDIEGQQIVIFDLSRTIYVDDSAAAAIGELIKQATDIRSNVIVISGLGGEMAKFLDSMGTLDRVPKENFAANMDEAKQIIRPLLHPQ